MACCNLHAADMARGYRSGRLSYSYQFSVISVLRGIDCCRLATYFILCEYELTHRVPMLVA